MTEERTAGRTRRRHSHLEQFFAMVGGFGGVISLEMSEAFETAQRHLKTYRAKVSALSGQERLKLDSPSTPEEKPLPLIDKASA